MSNLSEEEISMDIDEKSIEELKKAINYDELEKRHQRFMNGIETEDDLINNMYHYKIQDNNGLNLDVVELKYYNKILDLYNKEKEKNKKLKADKLDLVRKHNVVKMQDVQEELLSMRNALDIKNAEMEMLNTMMDHNYVSKNKIKEKIEEISGMNEIADIEREIYNRNEYAIEILLELLEE